MQMTERRLMRCICGGARRRGVDTGRWEQSRAKPRRTGARGNPPLGGRLMSWIRQTACTGDDDGGHEGGGGEGRRRRRAEGRERRRERARGRGRRSEQEARDSRVYRAARARETARTLSFNNARRPRPSSLAWMLQNRIVAAGSLASTYGLFCGMSSMASVDDAHAPPREGRL
ncbi:hypothetical protein VTN02DRAFT_5757 [Thermoascus thermophilus]